MKVLHLGIPGGVHAVDGKPLAHPQLEHDAVPQVPRQARPYRIRV